MTGVVFIKERIAALSRLIGVTPREEGWGLARILAVSAVAGAEDHDGRCLSDSMDRLEATLSHH